MTNELIERFFNRQCTPAEAAAVAEYLKTHPEVLERYSGYAEWLNTIPPEMPDEFWNENWTAISAGMARPVRKMVWLKRAAVAAVLVVGAGLAYKGLFAPAGKTTAVAAVSEPEPERKITVNNSGRMMDFFLPDSSEVRLSPGSLITYYLPFSGGKRDITLDGEGRFRVVKSEQQPFTVYAGGLATTALGTEFTINTRNNVSVKLHNGKVMISATGEMLRHWKKNVILLPGQQLDYNNRDMLVSVGAIKTDNAATAKIAVPRPKRISTPAVTPSLDFVNTPLPDVMDRLTAYYHQKIGFDRTALSHMNFTGTISRNDSLNIVLKVIAQMNDLQLTHDDDDGYELKTAEK